MGDDSMEAVLRIELVRIDAAATQPIQHGSTGQQRDIALRRPAAHQHGHADRFCDFVAGGPGFQGAGKGRLDGRSVGHRVGVRNPEFDHIRPPADALARRVERYDRARSRLEGRVIDEGKGVVAPGQLDELAGAQVLGDHLALARVPQRQVTAHLVEQVIDLERLGQVVDSAKLDGLDCLLDGAIRGHDQHRQIVKSRTQIAQQRPTVHRAHLHIGQHHVDRITIEPAEDGETGLFRSAQERSVGWRVYGIEGPGLSTDEVEARIEAEAKRFDMTRFLDRAVNNDLSGGEKKRSEIALRESERNYRLLIDNDWGDPEQVAVIRRTYGPLVSGDALAAAIQRSPLRRSSSGVGQAPRSAPRNVP